MRNNDHNSTLIENLKLSVMLIFDRYKPKKVDKDYEELVKKIKLQFEAKNPISSGSNSIKASASTKDFLVKNKLNK